MTTHNVPQSDRNTRSGGAILLILLGLFFLLQYFQVLPSLNNWWAIFIVLPGAVLLYEGFTQREADGSLMWTKVIVGALLAIVGVVFLFEINLDFLPDIDWAMIWPFILILAGVMLLLRRERSPR